MNIGNEQDEVILDNILSNAWTRVGTQDIPRQNYFMVEIINTGKSFKLSNHTHFVVVLRDLITLCCNALC